MWQAIQRFQEVLRRDGAQEGRSALYNVAALWAWQAHSSSDVESSSHRAAALLLLESIDAPSTERDGSEPPRSTSTISRPAASHDESRELSSVLLFGAQHSIDLLGQRDVQHMVARAAMRCAAWAPACGAYAQLLDGWQQQQDEKGEEWPSTSIDCIHREYCLALLRAAESESQEAQSAGSIGEPDQHTGETKRRTAVSLCEHVLQYRPHDVTLLLLLSEAQYELRQFEEALTAAQVAAKTLELLRSQQLTMSKGDAFLVSLAACGLTFTGQIGQQVPSLLVESYHQSGAVLWQLGRNSEAVEAYSLADRCIAGASTSTALSDMVVFSLTLGLWACGRREQASIRWAGYMGWEVGKEASYYKRKQSALAGHLDSVVPVTSVQSQQTLLLDKLVLEHLAGK